MSNKNGRGLHLSLVAKDGEAVPPSPFRGGGTPLEAAIAEHGPDVAPVEQPAGSRSASEVVGNAVMHAAMSWVACCMEIPADHVQVQQVAPGAFHATVHCKDGGTFMLAVALLLETGPRLTWQVEPIHP